MFCETGGFDKDLPLKYRRKVLVTTLVLKMIELPHMDNREGIAFPDYRLMGSWEGGTCIQSGQLQKQS